MATIRKRNKKWQVIVRRKGYPPQSRSFTYKEDAERWARKTERDIDSGDFLPQPMHGAVEASLVTLADVIDRYCETKLPLKKSAHVELYILKAVKRQSFAQLALLQQHPDSFRQYRDHRLTLVKPSTVVRELNLLSQCFELARLEYGLQRLSNPLEQVSLPKVRDARIRRLGGDEKEALLGAASRARVSYLSPLIILAIETGLRRGELLNLKWGDIDFERRELRVKTSKNGFPRCVVLSSEARQVLSKMYQGEAAERIFEVSSNAVRLSWQRLVRRSGIEDLRFHDLRHEAISRFFEKGLTLPEVAAMSGHRDPRMLMRYAHGILPGIKEKI